MTQRDKYRVIRKIDAGGMAEVFQGIAESIEGFTKNVAIKRVLPHLVENKKFIAMFLDEARLSLSMNHANVAHVFDIGKAGGTYFIVMEFVDGTDLRKMSETLKEQGQQLPIEQAVFIIMEVCRGLAYAHDLLDANGENLGIVHRDVSPPNVLLSRQGEVKLVDFGLAKATSQLEQTDPGVVKGKFAYLSPEAAWGKDVDRRADIFACGILLFELLTGQRLFLGANDVQTVELVRLGDVPSLSKINSDVKPELERIVRKALAQDADDRYSTCDQLAEDLASYLFSQQLKVTSFDIRRLIEKVVTIQREKQPIRRQSVIDQLIQSELGRFASIDNEDFLDPNSPEGGAVISTGGLPLDHLFLDGFKSRESDSNIEAGNTSAQNNQGEVGREFNLQKEIKSPLSSASLKTSENTNSVSLAHMLEGEIRIISEVPPQYESGKKSFFLGLFITVLVATLGVGTALVLGWIP